MLFLRISISTSVAVFVLLKKKKKKRYLIEERECRAFCSKCYQERKECLLSYRGTVLPDRTQDVLGRVSSNSFS